MSDRREEIMEKRRRCLPRDLRIKIYEDVPELAKKGLSYRKIVEEIKRRYGVIINTSHCSYWIRGIHSPYNGIRIPSVEFLRPSEDLSYVIGVVAGDGYAWRRGRPQRGYRDYYIGLMVKDREFDEEFGRRIANVLGREPPMPRLNKYGRWLLQFSLGLSMNCLRSPLISTGSGHSSSIVRGV